jgi:hypothetical protein
MPTPLLLSKKEFRTCRKKPALAERWQTQAFYSLTYVHAIGGAAQNQTNLVGAEVARFDAIIVPICTHDIEC